MWRPSLHERVRPEKLWKEEVMRCARKCRCDDCPYIKKLMERILMMRKPELKEVFRRLI